MLPLLIIYPQDGQNLPKKATFYNYDISNVKMINKIFNKSLMLFHFAAFINNEESLKFPKNIMKTILRKEKFFDNCIKIILINLYIPLLLPYMEIKIIRCLRMIS